MYLYPNYIGVYAEIGRFELAADWGAMDCFECDACVYVCPSNRPMVEFVRDTKKRVAARLTGRRHRCWRSSCCHWP